METFRAVANIVLVAVLVTAMGMPPEFGAPAISISFDDDDNEYATYSFESPVAESKDGIKDVSIPIFLSSRLIAADFRVNAGSGKQKELSRDFALFSFFPIHKVSLRE